MNPSELRQMAKSGRPSKAYEELTASDMVYDNTFDMENAGWVIFYYLKEGDCRQTEDAIERYVSIGVPRPSMLHSNILRLIGKKAEEIEELDLISTVRRLGLVFRDEDYLGTSYMGRNIPPLAESVFSDCYGKGMDFNTALELFQREGLRDEENIDWAFRTYSRCTYRLLWQYNQDENDEIRSYALVNRYLDETATVTDRKGETYSGILNSIIWDTNDQTLSSFKEIFEKWGMESFTDADWQKVRKGEEVYDSLAEKAIGKYIKSLKALRQSPSAGFEGLIDTALRHFPEDETYLRYKSRYLIKAGDRESAVQIYKKMIISGNKYYLWSELAEIISDTDLKTGCLSKAILLQRDDNFLGNIRLNLASLLMDRGKFAEASFELSVYESTYTRNSWGLKSEFHSLRDRIPQGTLTAKDNRDLYRHHARLADEFIYSGLPTEEVVLTGIRKRLNLLCHDGSFIETNPNAHGIRPDVKIHTLFDVKADRNGRYPKVVWLKSKGILSAKPATIDNINTYKGVFHLTGEDGTSYLARLDKSDFAPALGDQVMITAFRIDKPDGRKTFKILKITRKQS